MALKDITIGQYFPGNSVIHKMDPRMKIVLAIAYIVMLFMAKGFSGIAVGVVFWPSAMASAAFPSR